MDEEGVAIVPGVTCAELDVILAAAAGRGILRSCRKDSGHGQNSERNQAREPSGTPSYPQLPLHRALRIPRRKPRQAPRFAFCVPFFNVPRSYQTIQYCSVAIVRQTMWIFHRAAYLQQLIAAEPQEHALVGCKY